MAAASAAEASEPPLTCPAGGAGGSAAAAAFGLTSASLPPSPPPPSSPPSPSAAAAAPAAPAEANSCPYHASQQDAELNPLNRMPPPNQQPAEGQRAALSVHREVSTIPMGGAHDGKQWVYPSEQMFFNAMKRKQWTPSERDMAVVVPIHNSVNEQAWRHILRWERPYIDSGQCGQPKLLQFEGKPQELTPKARFMGWLGYKRPFDRHDWTVDRCGESVRYVIDFYGGEPDARGLPSFYLDVRPALDSVGAVKQRLQHLFSSLF